MSTSEAAAEFSDMKICPYCKEQIRADAIKCRYCQSMFSSMEPPKNSENGSRITYILDRDLVRFAKFAVAVLAIFLVVGAYLFGFKLESALEKVRSAQEDIKTAHEKTASAQKDLEGALVTVRNLKQEVDRVLIEAKANLGEISSTKSQAVALYASIPLLTPQQTAALQETKNPKLEKDRAGTYAKFWKVGSTIRVRFLDGDPSVHETVKSLAQEWTRYANLKFEFVTSGMADIRISFKPNAGTWSYVGTDVLVVPQDQPTMNIEQMDRAAILHHFGLALGLIKEQQNPNAHIPWDQELVYRETRGPPYYWTKEMVNQNIFHKYKQSELPDYRDFDPQSIMADNFPKAWTGGISIGGGQNLSVSDKRLLAKLYPGAK